LLRCRDNSSFQKGGRSQGSTAFVKGFDTSLGEDEVFDWHVLSIFVVVWMFMM